MHCSTRCSDLFCGFVDLAEESGQHRQNLGFQICGWVAQTGCQSGIIPVLFPFNALLYALFWFVLWIWHRNPASRDWISSSNFSWLIWNASWKVMFAFISHKYRAYHDSNFLCFSLRNMLSSILSPTVFSTISSVTLRGSRQWKTTFACMQFC